MTNDVINMVRSLTDITPDTEQVSRIKIIRGDALQLGATIVTNIKSSRERSLALTHLEETVMWAVKAILIDHTQDITEHPSDITVSKWQIP